MNYEAHYDRLIARAQIRILTGYKERHHIVPKCIGGGNNPDNLVYLTAEEHYVAHQLLVKTHPEAPQLAHAATMMATRCSGNKAYGWLRRRAAAERRGKKLSPATIAKMTAFFRSYKKTPEHIEKLRIHLKALALRPDIAKARAERARGNTYMLGKKKSPEAVEKTAAVHRGKIVSVETRKKIAAARTGKPLSIEHRAKVSASLIGNTRTRGYKQSQAARAKVSAAQLGKKRGPHSAETKAKIGAANTGNKWTPEARAAMSAARRGKPHSPEHRANLAEANRRRAREAKALRVDP